MINKKSLLFLIFLISFIHLASSEVIALENLTNLPDPKGIYSQHFSNLYGENSFKANILGFVDHASMLK